MVASIIVTGLLRFSVRVSGRILIVGITAGGPEPKFICVAYIHVLEVSRYVCRSDLG